MEPEEQLWDRFAQQVAGLHAVVMADRPKGDQIDAEGLRYMLRYLAAGITTCVEFDDSQHPEFGSLIENRRSWGLDNPDTKYSFTRIEPDARYALSGEVGDATELELQVDTGHFADGRFTEWQSLHRWRRGDRTLPLDHRGELALEFTAPPGSSYLHLREYFGDWETESPALLAVERLDAPMPPPALSLEDMERRLELLGLWLTAGARCWADLGRGLAAGDPGPITPFLPPSEATGLGGQAYGMGAYECGEADAVLLEFLPPPCSYWSVSLATWFWESPDIANRQCSLNHTQAQVDEDGVVRIVLAQRDPGVANWLDAAGHRRGTIAFRLLDAEDPPTLDHRRLQLAEVASYLPEATVEVTPRQRAETLRARRRALLRRYRR